MLGHEEHDEWFKRMRQCAEANATLLDIQKRADELRHQALDIRLHEDEVAAEILNLEQRRGELNRSRLRPLKQALASMADDVNQADHQHLRKEHDVVEKEGAALLLALAAKLKERHAWRTRRQEINRRLRALERGGKAAEARRILRTVERAAEKARLNLARNAILAAEGLPHADLRPAAWWMPAVDPSGKWFDHVARTARYRLEPLVT
jgi:hypothetical protein